MSTTMTQDELVDPILEMVDSTIIPASPSDHACPSCDPARDSGHCQEEHLPNDVRRRLGAALQADSPPSPLLVTPAEVSMTSS